MSLVVQGPFHGESTIGDFVRIYEIASFQSKFNPAYRTIHPSRFLTSGGRIREILKAEKPDLIAINDRYTLIDLGPPNAGLPDVTGAPAFASMLRGSPMASAGV